MILSHDMFRSIDGRYTELLISCTTSHVEATLLYYERNIATSVLAHARVPLGIRYPYNKQDVYEATYVALEDACRAIALDAHELFAQQDLLKDHQKINKVRMFIGGPWVDKHYHTTRKQWSQSHVVTDADIDSLLQQAIPQGRTRVSNHVTAAFANGYAVEVETLVGQKLRDIEVSYVDIFARIDLMETLFQVVHAELNIPESQFEYHATMAALASATQEYYQPDKDYLQLFVHGAHTDILVHERGHVVYAGTLEWGYDQIIESMLDAGLAPSRVQAISLLSSFTAGYLHDDTNKQVTSMVRDYIERLTDAVVGSSDQDSIAIPQDWYIFAEEHIAKFIHTVCQSRSSTARAVLVRGRDIQSPASDKMSNLAAIQVDYIGRHIHNTIEK